MGDEARVLRLRVVPSVDILTMPYIIRNTSDGAQGALWAQFRERAQREGHSIAWVLWQLVRRYVERGLD